MAEFIDKVFAGKDYEKGAITYSNGTSDTTMVLGGHNYCPPDDFDCIHRKPNVLFNMKAPERCLEYYNKECPHFKGKCEIYDECEVKEECCKDHKKLSCETRIFIRQYIKGKGRPRGNLFEPFRLFLTKLKEITKSTELFDDRAMWDKVICTNYVYRITEPDSPRYIPSKNLENDENNEYLNSVIDKYNPKIIVILHFKVVTKRAKNLLKNKRYRYLSKFSTEDFDVFAHVESNLIKLYENDIFLKYENFYGKYSKEVKGKENIVAVIVYHVKEANRIITSDVELINEFIGLHPFDNINRNTVKNYVSELRKNLRTKHVFRENSKGNLYYKLKEEMERRHYT